MRGLHILPVGLLCAVLAAGCYDDCWDEECWGGDYWEGDAGWDDGGWDEWGEAGPRDLAWMCDTDEDCRSGQVCDPFHQCRDVVLGCPLTDECLGDPPGHQDEDLREPEPPEEDWRGIDPVFIGALVGDGIGGRVEVDLDFYDDHLYGEGVVAVSADAGDDREGAREEVLWVFVTGTRDGSLLSGQVIEQDGERTFDAQFSAEMVSASELQGTFSVGSDAGTHSGSFHLWRASPCGCEPETECTTGGDCEDGHCSQGQCVACVLSRDCLEGQSCLDGRCVVLCGGDADCGEDSMCQGGVCMPWQCTEECCSADDCLTDEVCVGGSCFPEGSCLNNSDCDEDEECRDGACTFVCPYACCGNEDCDEGQQCMENTCETTCERRCECDAGQVCEQGKCVTPDEPPPPECDDDCDCDMAAGERCHEGVCHPES